MVDIHTFGFNAFHQLSVQDSAPKVYNDTLQQKTILFATWESTFYLDSNHQLQIQGFTTDQIRAIVTTWNRNGRVAQVFGTMDVGLGMIDHLGQCWWVHLAESPLYGLHLKLAVDIRQAGLCQGMGCLFLLSCSGDVYRCDLVDTDRLVQLDLPTVCHLAVSSTHALFATKGPSPVYAIGSNRLGQLGLPVGEVQEVNEQPAAVDFFDGLLMGDDLDDDTVLVACGPFHSAVILQLDVYTFGWNDRGRLGWSSQEEADTVQLATFADNQDGDHQIEAVQVQCGFHHTVVLDSKANVWTSGSNDYYQLARRDVESRLEQDGQPFLRCPWRGKRILTGPWSTYIME
ncbi:RCC1/BLIP-II protein [Hesseltinella vesiculosa]|uniref:RCC1/BLIP-II protein n=1 Tax=Hesseltinella vesiculosa TaxID=101127 RepID=A0A1X2GV71_9FUNG|nr:RCC1/BLIP-II protein [Hesseltinella vesiculosa]